MRFIRCENLNLVGILQAIHVPRPHTRRPGAIHLRMPPPGSGTNACPRNQSMRFVTERTHQNLPMAGESWRGEDMGFFPSNSVMFPCGDVGCGRQIDFCQNLMAQPQRDRLRIAAKWVQRSRISVWSLSEHECRCVWPEGVGPRMLGARKIVGGGVALCNLTGTIFPPLHGSTF